MFSEKELNLKPNNHVEKHGLSTSHFKQDDK